MYKPEFEAIFNQVVADSSKVLLNKSKDYATDDVLSNFKRLAGIAKLYNIDVSEPRQYALFMVLLKLDRIQNLLTNNKTPTNESVEDSYIDGFNYLMLSYACLKEQNNGTSRTDI
jgi:hypothetical protein